MEAFEEALVERTKRAAREAGNFALEAAGFVYNPLVYAWAPHEAYLRCLRRGAAVFFLGMNPGPFGMAQTGVPFGEVSAVRDWLRIGGDVSRPEREHPARPVLGFGITRSEVSGRRFWGLLREHYGSPASLFKEVCVMNYCPLLFLDNGPTARNITPDTLPRPERGRLEALCDAYLDDVLTLVQPRFLVGVGRYARAKLEAAASRLAARGFAFQTGAIPHPSPANPAANRGWSATTAAALRSLGAWAPLTGSI